MLNLDGLTISILVMIFGGFTAFSTYFSRQPISEANLRTTVPHFKASSFVTTYFPIPFFLVLSIGYAIYAKSDMVKYEEMDFSTGSSADIPNEPAVSGFWGKVEEYI